LLPVDESGRLWRDHRDVAFEPALARQSELAASGTQPLTFEMIRPAERSFLYAHPARRAKSVPATYVTVIGLMGEDRVQKASTDLGPKGLPILPVGYSA
jgi:hypothetical protein